MLRRRPDNALEFRLIEAKFAAAGPFPLATAVRERMKERIFARLDAQERREPRFGFTERDRWVAVPAGIGIAASIVAAIKLAEKPESGPAVHTSVAQALGSVTVDGRPATEARSGQRIVANGEAWLTVGERIRINLDDQSEVQIEGGGDSLRVRLYEGQATIVTTDARVAVAGSNWSAEVGTNSVVEFASSPESTLMRVFEGLVAITPDGGEPVSVREGEPPLVIPVAPSVPSGAQGSAGPMAPGLAVAGDADGIPLSVGEPLWVVASAAAGPETNRKSGPGDHANSTSQPGNEVPLATDVAAPPRDLVVTAPSAAPAGTGLNTSSSKGAESAGPARNPVAPLEQPQQGAAAVQPVVRPEQLPKVDRQAAQAHEANSSPGVLIVPRTEPSNGHAGEAAVTRIDAPAVDDDQTAGAFEASDAGEEPEERQRGHGNGASGPDTRPVSPGPEPPPARREPDVPATKSEQHLGAAPAAQPARDATHDADATMGSEKQGEGVPRRSEPKNDAIGGGIPASEPKEDPADWPFRASELRKEAAPGNDAAIELEQDEFRVDTAERESGHSDTTPTHAELDAETDGLTVQGSPGKPADGRPGRNDRAEPTSSLPSIADPGTSSSSQTVARPGGAVDDGNRPGRPQGEAASSTRSPFKPAAP